ncbi:MAG: hypothetical protein AABZ79_24640, partial [Pseudomonadota bacterium]
MNTSAERVFIAWSDGGCSTAESVAERSDVDEQAERKTASATAPANLRMDEFMTPFPMGMAAFRASAGARVAPEAHLIGTNNVLPGWRLSMAPASGCAGKRTLGLD